MMNDLNQNEHCAAAHVPFPGPSSSSVVTGMAPPAPGPIRRRRFSTAKIQPTRIKKVMQSDEEIGRMVASVPVAIGRAMEHFAEKFLQAASQATHNSNSRTLTPIHMKQAMMANPHFFFLDSVLKEVPTPGRMGEFDPNAMRIQMQLMNGIQSSLSAPAQSPISSPCGPLTPNPYASPAPSPASISNSSLPYSPILPSMMVGQIHAPVTASHQYPPSVIPMVPVSMGAMESQSLQQTVKKANGKRSDIPEGEKPKRGRPRKIKKTDKCLDDELCEEVSSGIEMEDKDRALMPPPALPFGRAKPVA